MDSTRPTITEADILDQVIRPDQPGLSPESARAILDLRFGPAVIPLMLRDLQEGPRL